MRTVGIIVGLLLLMGLLLGCEGESRHTIDTGEHGSLFGLLLTPAPQSLSIDLNEDFYLDWEPGTYPPSTFEVALRKVNADGDTEPVYTNRTTNSTGHYRLSPTTYLPTRTFLLLTVTAENGERVRAMYLTENTYLPQTRKATEGEGQAVHVIHTP